MLVTESIIWRIFHFLVIFWCIKSAKNMMLATYQSSNQHILWSNIGVAKQIFFGYVLYNSHIPNIDSISGALITLSLSILLQNTQCKGAPAMASRFGIWGLKLKSVSQFWKMGFSTNCDFRQQKSKALFGKQFR